MLQEYLEFEADGDLSDLSKKVTFQAQKNNRDVESGIVRSGALHTVAAIVTLVHAFVANHLIRMLSQTSEMSRKMGLEWNSDFKHYTKYFERSMIKEA